MSELEALIAENQQRRKREAEGARAQTETAAEVSWRTLADPEQVSAHDRQREEELNRLRTMLEELGIEPDPDDDDEE